MGVKYWTEIHAIQEKLEKVVGTGAPGTWRAGEVLWGDLRLGDVFEVPDLGTVTVVDVHEELDDFIYWSQPIFVVLQVGDRHFRAAGKNVSHEGHNWEYPVFCEVEPRVESRKVWTGADR